MRRHSLVGRAIAAVLLMEALCAVAFISTAFWYEWRSRIRALDTVLEGRSDSLMGAVQDLEDPGYHVYVDPAEFRPAAGDMYAVYDERGNVVGSSKTSIPDVVALSRDGVRALTADGRHYRVLQRHALRIIDREETNGVGRRRPVTIVYAASTDHLWREVMHATEFYGLVSLGLLCVTALMLIWLLRRLLAPLEDLAASAAEIKTDALAFEPPSSARGVSELAPLSEALSGMMTRVRAAFDSQHRFIHDAAHELKTAVAIVRSTIQVLRMRDRTASEYQRGLDQALTDNERVEELVRQMLTLASVEEHGDNLRGACDLGEEVEHAAGQLQSVAQSRAVSVRCDAEPGLVVALSREAVGRLATNLILNAVQYSNQGAEVFVTVRRQGSIEPGALLQVKDSGSGIEPKNLERIFERFFREDASRSRETGGTGLGLSICKSLVDAADGTIHVESEPGKGTTVTVALPAVAAEETAALDATRPVVESTLRS